MTSSTAPRNRLAGETSPYLLQHAANPVDWHPWDEESLALAKRLDRPIFLSIGYCACHWCHVMEHESFENPDIAAAMNAGFVNIKVDREERPDLDQIYMNAVHGADRQRRLADVGLPHARSASRSSAERIGRRRRVRPAWFSRSASAPSQDAWTNRRDAVLEQAEELTAAVVQASLPAESAGELQPDILRHARRSLAQKCGSHARRVRHGTEVSAPDGSPRAAASARRFDNAGSRWKS